MSKLAKAAANYQAHPKGRERCDGCQMWIKPKPTVLFGSCTLVAGSIAGHGWCKYWEPKGFQPRDGKEKA